jgi:hypothetical protein
MQRLDKAGVTWYEVSVFCVLLYVRFKDISAPKGIGINLKK